VGLGVLIAFKSRLRSDSLVLETTWTFIPVLILLFIVIPSLGLLCSQDALSQNPSLTLKMIRNQWNWQSESEESYDHLLDSERTDIGSSLEVPISLTRKTETRVVTVRTDVLHSLGVPRIGVKLDTAPGRIRATTLRSLYPGLFMGSCYELCGRGHSAMPFSLLVIYELKSSTVSLQSLKFWVTQQCQFL